jgi:cytoskeletal protein RodZ
MMEGAMQNVFWVIVAVIVLAVAYALAQNLRKRKGVFGREPSMSDVAPSTKEHGVDLQAHRKTYDDVT